MVPDSAEFTLLKNCLNLSVEPIGLVFPTSELMWLNRELRNLLSAPSEVVSLSDYWPGFIERELLPGSLMSEFRSAPGGFVSVKLITELVDPGVYCLRVASSRFPGDEVKVMQVQRREMLGELAGGIAHDINNIVTGILGHVTYLKMTMPKSGPHVDSLNAIEEGGNRTGQLVRQILSFLKNDTSMKISRLNLSQVIESTCNLLRGAITKKIRLTYEIPQNPTFVLGIEGQISQILVNLVINSRDAIRDNGDIRVAIRELETSEVIGPVGEIQGSEQLHGKYACLTIIDNGQGISDEIIGKVFEPYFSTKRDRGTGLGLSTVKEIVERMGGVIEISSKVGIGTKVSVYLPVAEEESTKVESTAKGAELQRGNERILVCDDEQSVRNVLGLSLRRLGYEVELASSGSEAISKYIAAGSRYDLVILDMVMPELSGREVFFRLKEIDPGVRVLICSGFASEQAIQDILSNGGKGLIQKPFDVESLAEKIRECLR
jgi:signal transduction histidine kinase/CheY-like chemotaxis protein